jgi:hypothetical protein
MTIDVNVVFVDIPMHGCCHPNEDGSYTIFLRRNDPPEVQKRTYLHEYEHISLGHCEMHDPDRAEKENPVVI